MAVQSTPTPRQLSTILQSASNMAYKWTPEVRTKLMDTVQRFVELIPPFRLLDLPPELRNRIYELVVVKTKYPLLPSACKHDYTPTAIQPPITRVNKQIREESLTMFYGLSDFEVHIHCCDFGYFISHMGILSTESRKHIRNVRLVLMDSLRCGEGLLDFVRWCATADDTGEMTLHPDLRNIGDPNAEDGICACNVDADEECHICITGWAVQQAIVLAGRTCNGRQLSEQHVRRAFADWVVEEELECVCLEEDEENKGRCSRYIPIIGNIGVLFG